MTKLRYFVHLSDIGLGIAIAGLIFGRDSTRWVAFGIGVAVMVGGWLIKSRLRKIYAKEDNDGQATGFGRN